MQNESHLLSNNPPSDVEILQTGLRDRHGKLLKRAEDLNEALGRIPARIEDDEMAGKAGDFIKQITGCRKALEAERVNEKEPFLSQGRAVDGFFKTFTDMMDKTKKFIEEPLNEYLKRKAAEERRRLAEEAEKQRQEAAERQAEALRLEQAKMTPQADDAMEEAANSEAKAAVLQQQSEARPAQLAQSRGAAGSLASLRTRWVGEMVSQDAVDLERLRHHLSPESLQKAINSYVAAGGRELKGAHIYEKSETVVR